MSFASLSHFTYNHILQNKKTRLPATFSSLTPDCSSIDVAEKSNQPQDWLFHPTGFVFQFDATQESAEGAADTTVSPKGPTATTETAFFNAQEKFELIQSALKNGDKISTLDDVFMLNNEMTKLRAQMIEKVAKSAQTQVENEMLTKLVKFWEK